MKRIVSRFLVWVLVALVALLVFRGVGWLVTTFTEEPRLSESQIAATACANQREAQAVLIPTLRAEISTCETRQAPTSPTPTATPAPTPTDMLQDVGTSEQVPTIPSILEPVIGLATYYDYGPLMANGDAFDPDATTCAVDCSLFPELRGHVLSITTIAGYGCNATRTITATVTDCGYLLDEGSKAYGVQNDILAWWPSAEPGALYHAVDLTARAAQELCGGETVAVEVKVER